MQHRQMYTRESVSTDRYNADDSSSGRDEAQNTTAVSSDWSVRPSDDTTADSMQTNSLSRLNPAAAPFSFNGGSPVGGAPGRDEMMGMAQHSSSNSGGGGGSAGGGPGSNSGMHHHAHHHPGMLSGSSLDGSSVGVGGMPGAGSRGGMGMAGPGLSSNGGSAAQLGLDGVNPNSFGMMSGMVPGPYGMPGGHRASPLTGRAGGMMDYGGMHGGGGAAGGVGAGGPMGMSGGGMGGRMGVGVGGLGSPNSFLPPPGEDTDQQELMRLQQTNYRVKMLPPPLTYEVHRKIWTRNEYGNDDDDDFHGGSAEAEEESLHSLMNEDPIDKEQRLEAYKQIMLRWYSHIHVLEVKSEVAKRLVRVRRACPSMDEIIASLANPQPPSGAATGTGSEGGEEDASYTQQQQQAPAAATATRRSPSDPLDTEEILATWSARCWDWWQETVKRKPRRARKQGELPMGTGAGLPTSASAPMVAAMGDGYLPHSLSARAMDVEATSPHMAGGAHAYSHHSPYAGHANGSFMESGAGNGAGMPMAPSYTSFTDISEDGGVDGAVRLQGRSPQQQQQQQQQLPSRPSSHPSPQLSGPPPPQQRMTPPQQPQQQQQQQQQAAAGSHESTPPASIFTTNGIRAAAPRSGNPDDFLENDHLTLAFTTELLKSLEE